MILTIRFILFVVSVGWIGWIAWHSLVRSEPTEKNEPEPTGKAYLIFLTGFAIVSIGIFLLALSGIFQWYGVLSILLVLLVFAAFKNRKSKTGVRATSGQIRSRPAALLSYTLFCILLALFSSGLSVILKPVEAIVMANDATIYLGTAFHLAESGTLINKDPLALEMFHAEREQIFRNRFRSDKTGRYARFPGGVPFANIKEASTTFSFYHLFPTWLALGIKALGPQSFLSLMSLFLTLTMFSLFFLGRDFGGVLLGISLPVVLFFFYPQVYFSRMPYSELLAQSLFLSGLWIIVAGLKNRSVLPVGHQRVAGMLWGALFLTRLETIYIFILSFVLIFFLLPSALKNIPKPKTLLLYLAFMALLGLFHQLRRGEYLYILSLTLSRNWSPSQTFLLNYPFALTIFLATAFVFLFFLAKYGTINRWKVNQPWVRKISGLIIVILLLSFLPTRYWSWELLKLNVSWLFLYIPTELYFVLYGGIFLYGWFFLRNQSRSYEWLTVILFLVTLCVFLINPMVSRVQPMGIRRHIAIFFPLMFLLSLCGWFRFLHTRAIRNPKLSKAIFASIVATCTIFFAADSWHLIRKDLYGNAFQQIQGLAKHIPDSATVIIPDSEAAMHLQIPLQYLFHRNTLLLPFRNDHSQALESAKNYLRRQLDQNRTILVLTTGSAVPTNVLSRTFELKSENPYRLNFFIVPDHPAGEFPRRTEQIVVPCNLLVLQNRGEIQVRNEIGFNEPGVVFNNFYLAESKYRWTQEISELTGFRFPTNNKEVILVLSTAFPHPVYSAKDLNIKITVNKNIPATFLKEENNDFHFLIASHHISEITSIGLESTTFIPVQRKINSDTRKLGFPFVRVRLISAD